MIDPNDCMPRQFPPTERESTAAECTNYTCLIDRKRGPNCNGHHQEHQGCKREYAGDNPRRTVAVWRGPERIDRNEQQ